MKIRLRGILLTVLMLAVSATANGQQSPVRSADTVYFHFIPEIDMFYDLYKENSPEIARLYSLIDDYRAEISSGEIPVHVESYCGSLPTSRENLNTAFVRANRVKSEMIVRKGLVEDNFRTHNHTTPYTDPAGNRYKDIVVVTLRIPAKIQPIPETKVVFTEPAPQPAVKEEPKAEIKPAPEREVVVVTNPIEPEHGQHRFAVRSNLLYDAFLVPTLGAEWRIDRHIGIKLDGSLSWWGDKKGKVQKTWALSPEVRWHLTPGKRLYVGVGANYAEYNLYKYRVGGAFSDDTGYQGTLWNAGLTVGYQLRLGKSWSVDFNLGLGYNRSNYDSFTLQNEVRVYKDHDKSKIFWGPTQVGITLVWGL